METDNNYYVYMHINKINNKKYIGITKTSLYRRWGKGGSQYLIDRHLPFARAIEKYGWDNFVHLVLYEHLTQSEACDKEIELIYKYRTQDSDYGYNIQPGGQLGNTGVVFTEEHRKKLSESKKGRKLSAEWRKKISEAVTGHRPAVHSLEFIEQQRLRNLGKIMPEETKRKISKTLKGIKRSPETLKKRKEHSTILVKVYSPELDMEFESIADAARYSGAQRSNIQKCLKGKRYTSGRHSETNERLHWKKVEK